MISHEPRCIYESNPLGEVICQLRFPEILSIETDLPAKFQDMIRDVFPRYSLRRENSGPNTQTNNYQFATDDGVWRVNLTSKFIALATSRYTRWEEFAAMLDKPLAAFIQIYKPACFDRIGLRYLNFISRRELGLEGVPFRELIAPAYLGLLAEEDVPEHTVGRCSVDCEMALNGGAKLKLHAGPGKVTRGGKADEEVKFILDLDLYMSAKVPVNLSAGSLQTLHSQAFGIFRGGITDRLHNAMA